MVRQIPIILGVIAIVGLTIVESVISGRFEKADMTAEQFAQLLERVDMTIGDWQGEDLEVKEQVRETAGAKGYVSRRYHNNLTGKNVTIWLIVGHSRDVVRHTPDVCYPSSGFMPRASQNSRHTFAFDDQPEADFYTNTFIREDVTGRQIERVFWAWYKPNAEGTVRWQAPKTVRWEFGNTPSLYKLYFSSSVNDPRETADESPCVKFAEEFLPVAEKALSSIQPGDADDDSADTESGVDDDASTA